MQPGKATANKFPTFNPCQESKANKARLVGRCNAAKKINKKNKKPTSQFSLALDVVRFNSSLFCGRHWVDPVGCGAVLHLLSVSTEIGSLPDRLAPRSEENLRTELPGRKWCKANYLLSLIHPHHYSAASTLVPWTRRAR